MTVAIGALLAERMHTAFADADDINLRGPSTGS